MTDNIFVRQNNTFFSLFSNITLVISEYLDIRKQKHP